MHTEAQLAAGARRDLDVIVVIRGRDVEAKVACSTRDELTAVGLLL
jgi:hypothetical protein